MQDYTLYDPHETVKHAVAEGNTPGSNKVTAALIAEFPDPVQGLLMHAYRAMLRGTKVPES